VIQLENVCRSFGDFNAVQDVSFALNSGSGITGLLGPNGAGKTTTMRMITGYLRPTSGNITVDGMSVLDEDRITEIKRTVGYLPETTPLYPEMLVSEYLDFMGRVRGVAEPALKAAADEMVERLSLASHLYSPIGILSKGFRQRVALAGTLIHRPRVIILDEPTSGLDPNQISEIRTLIRDLGKTAALILSTHILQEVEELCSRVIVISRGRLVADASMDSLKSGHACSIVAKGQGVREKLASYSAVKSVQVVDRPRSDGYQQFICELGEDAPEKMFAFLASTGFDVREFAPVSKSLQSVFEELTGQ
jgi:ABC-2 type transport system ATP-binding protein